MPNDFVDVVEELIRFDSPLQFFQRYALEDIEIGGHDIKKGSKVAILLGSANRDPRAFEDPDTINFKREMKDHSSWGGGIHFCIGTHLAKLELGVSFNHILEKEFQLIEEPSRTGALLVIYGDQSRKEALDKDTYLDAVSNATNIILESSLTIDQ